jgi:SRSO17 transposase
MTPAQLKKLDKALGSYLDYLTDGMGRPERRRALAWYLTGLLLDGERKTVVGMANRLVEDDREAEAMRQRLQQCVTISRWADEELRRRLALRFEQTLKPEVYVVDDTGFPKKGKYSVGVTRQYSGTLGRTDNCQVAPSLHVASDDSSGCIGMRLYLPEEWASNIPRRRQASVPEDVVFKKKWEIALDLLDETLAAGLPPRLLLADAGYGDSTGFRDGLAKRGCPYLVGISAARLVWPPGSRPRIPKRKSGAGRPATRARDSKHQPQQVAELAKTLRFRRYAVPDAKGGKKEGHFAFARVRSAERHTKGRPPSDELWLICEWRPGNNERKYYFSNLPATTSKKELVRLLKLRWRVERDYQELKGQVGLDHFEGRTWRGFHHHVTLCAAAHGFLAIQRRLFPPENLSLDVAHGATSHPAPAHRPYRRVPALSSALRPCEPRPRSLENVIRWY